MLQHLTTSDVIQVLSHFSNSGSLYLLTTTISSKATSPSLSRGRCRNLNLEIPPAQLEPPLCLVRDGPVYGKIKPWVLFPGLWKLPLRQVKPCKIERVDPRPFGVNKHFYSCA